MPIRKQQPKPEIVLLYDSLFIDVDDNKDVTSCFLLVEAIRSELTHKCTLMHSDDFLAGGYRNPLAVVSDVIFHCIESNELGKHEIVMEEARPPAYVNRIYFHDSVIQRHLDNDRVTIHDKKELIAEILRIIG